MAAKTPKAIVVGAGIVGQAVARALAIRGYKVQIFDRSSRPVGASLRSSGLLWPVGQPNGELYERAVRSVEIWRELCRLGGFWHDRSGSLHVARREDEMEVIEEFVDICQGYRDVQLLTPEATLRASRHVRVGEGQKLYGALWSPDEMVVDCSKLMAALPRYLQERLDVEFIWDTAITDIRYPNVYSGGDLLGSADRIFVCSGPDLETLYPALLMRLPITKCKLQMLRLKAQTRKMGPALCAGLSLTHQPSFKVCPSWQRLKSRIAKELPEHEHYGIHVCVAQNARMELTVGDSHEYGLTHDPFDKGHINQLILDYLKGFTAFDSYEVTETWNGVYPQMLYGDTELVETPDEGVTVVNCLGGAGMTLSMGLAELIVERG